MCSVHGCTVEAEIHIKESLDKLSTVLELDMDLISNYTNMIPLRKDYHREMYKQLHPTHFIENPFWL